MIFRIFLGLAGAFILAACNPGAQLEDAQAGIKQFQANYNRGDTEALYDSVGEVWRKESPPAQLEAQLGLLKARLGQIESTEQVGFNAGFNNGLTTTQVVMKTTFEKGVAEEVYLFHGAGEEMKVVSWRVNSPMLQLSPEELRRLNGRADGATPAR